MISPNVNTPANESAKLFNITSTTLNTEPLNIWHLCLKFCFYDYDKLIVYLFSSNNLNEQYLLVYVVSDASMRFKLYIHYKEEQVIPFSDQLLSK